MLPALSYAKGDTDVALLCETIGQNLASTVAARPQCEALVEVPTGRRWTYAQFLNDVHRLATAMLYQGIRPGDRVGIWSPNTAEWTLVQYATAQIGAILVTINPAYQRNELEYVLNQAGVTTLIAAESFKASDYRAMLNEVHPRCPRLREAIIVGSRQWSALTSTAADLTALDSIAGTLRPSDPINIQYTSGTTGFPKGATLTHLNILNNGYLVGENLQYSEQDRVCIPVPFYHCFGMVIGNLACTSHAATMVIPAPGFDPDATLRAVAAERCTSLYGVPTMFIAELALDTLDDHDLSSLRTGIMAGSPCPEKTMREVMARLHMSEVTICYGMTETSPVSTQTRPTDTLYRRVSTVGQVGPHVEIQIIDPATGSTVPRNEPGELCTRGYSVMAGYWNDAAKTAEAIDASGWMHTGDIAVMDDDGFVQIAGRIKDIVIRGGENIYPQELEEFLRTHPDVADAQVVGVPDEKYGEELIAWLRIKPGASTLTVDAIRAFCSGRIAHYKIPRYVQVCDEYPMTVTGKVRKTDLRQQALMVVRD
ncbi:AMP-binding protein [Mycobacterium intracellulare]|uniref:AMP-binding protein n=1 Tax=Mycobacterium intracellulare TaxID=1767 RepID=UPI001B347AD2|nr:AMP-binding protein [Mycobacterium intracellulare]